ncbi:LppU/SCO3897 family protein [Nocardia donostiensis]|nr:hypothetical protein [Nocardia donostiensis]
MKFPGMRLLARIVLAIVAAVALAVAVIGCSAVEDAGSDAAKSDIGDCINVIENSVSESMVDSKTEPVDCSSEKAVYQVVETHQSKTECAQGQTPYEETMNGGTTAFLCLAPNFTEGSCYAEGESARYSHIDCAAPEASFRVIQRIDGEVDELQCGTDAVRFITVSEPKTTFCLGAAEV